MQKNTKTANIFSKMTNVNKSYDYTKKQKFVDLEKAKARLAQTSTQRFGVENLQSCKNNLHYESDVRPRESEGKKEQDSNQRNLLPDSDLEEILDKFIMMEKIINYKGFMQSMRFILKEIKGRFPKSGAFLEKVETCYEKLINFLLILVENSENHEKKEKEEEKNQNNLKKNKNLSEKASQTQREEEPWREKLEQLIIDNHNMEKQNNRMILIIENLNKRGIDIEKLFEKQMDSLLNPNHRLSFMEIKKLHMDSEG